MFGSRAARVVPRAVSGSEAILSRQRWSNSRLQTSNCPFSSSSRRVKNNGQDDPYRGSSTTARPEEKQAHEGSFSRTDREVSFEYPDEADLPRSQSVQGRGGPHLLRTLPSFSLEGHVAVVTGGARGLGLVMGQGIIESGADLAIVDLNSKKQFR